MLPEHAEMNQYVALEGVADDKSEASRRIEPFYPPDDGVHLGRAIIRRGRFWRTIIRRTGNGHRYYLRLGCRLGFLALHNSSLTKVSVS